MRTPFGRSLMALAMVALVGVLSLFVRPTAGQQFPAFAGPRTANGRPSLSGVWQAMNAANDDIQTHAARPALALTPGPLGPVPALPVLLLGAGGGIPGGLGVVEGETIPYQPWAAAKKQENLENSLTRDPAIKCYLPGVPRANYMPYSFQIVQGTTDLMMIYEFAGATRTIHMDKVPPAPADTWMGDSHGRWEGNTLVVDVTSFNDQTWFDRAGDFHSDALHVVERYTPASPYHLNYEVTIEDAKVFTRPWKMSMPLYRRMDKNAQLIEYKCVEFVEELMYGVLRKQPVNRRWEGDLGEPSGSFVFELTRKPPIIK